MRSNTTLKKLLRNSIKKAIYGEWKELGYYIISESINITIDILPLTKNVKCPLCQKSKKNFIHLGNKLGINWNSSCQNCDSRSRHRGLFFLYNYYLRSTKTIKILHFAPEPSLRNYLESLNLNYYHTTDLNMIGVDYPNQDIQNLKLNDSSYDLVLINHVLEHVKNDKIALSEIARILKTNGRAIITVPGDWKRIKTKTFHNLDFNGHYRDYGLDIINLMKIFFKNVQVCNLFQFDGFKHAIKKDERAFICKK